MKTAAIAIALLMSGAAFAQTGTTTVPDVDVDADVGVQPDGDLDVDADVDVDTKTVTTTNTTSTDAHATHTTTTETTTHVATSLPAASGAVVAPGNNAPEHDARGIPVISDPAAVPAGFNGVQGGAMGGPLVDATTGAAASTSADSYPACTATVTDNCVQTYERSRRR